MSSRWSRAGISEGLGNDRRMFFSAPQVVVFINDPFVEFLGKELLPRVHEHWNVTRDPGKFMYTPRDAWP